MADWPLKSAKIAEHLAACIICVVFCCILLQVLFNVTDGVIQIVGGTPLGLSLPSYTEISGFLLASTTFLALAGTFLADEHIRVKLFLDRLPASGRRTVGIFCLTVATGITAMLCWGSGQLLHSSLKFGDTSYGLLPVPLWIPQSTFVLGTAIFLACLIRALFIAVCIEPAGASDDKVSGDSA